MGACLPRTSVRASMTSWNQRRDVVLNVPGGVLHLMEGDNATELAKGDFKILKMMAGDVFLATVAAVGDVLWPLTKDEPVVKVDEFHYIFTLPVKDGSFLNYGVTFLLPDSRLALMDRFLKENTCFSTSYETSSKKLSPSYDVYWKDYTARIDDYNDILARAIIGGTGEIVKGIFKLSDAYITKVQRGAEWFLHDPASGKPDIIHRNGGSSKIPREVGVALKRVRKLSEVTEKVTQTLLDGVLGLTNSAATALFRSGAVRAFFGTAPGEVMLASLEAMNRTLDAVEAAERKTIAATSTVVSGAVSKRFGEDAGEVSEDVFATAGHVVGTAWNIFKIRKAVKPSSLQPSMLRNTLRKP